MPISNWKTIVELSSAAAILAGLVFVGVQMRQEQAISTAALQQEMITSRLSLSELTRREFCITGQIEYRP